MATRKARLATVAEPNTAPATGSITLPEMPPAETFVGLVAYGVDTVANESKQIPLEFLASGVQACIKATSDSATQTELAKTATANADTATEGANQAAEVANDEAENLSALKEAVADATADSIKKTKAAETATGAANTATTNANEATADAIAKTEAAQTAANEASAAKDAAIEATENLTGEVSALVLTDANKLSIQELSGIDYSNTTEQIVPGEFWPDSVTGQPKQVYTRTFSGTTIPVGSDFMGTLVHLLPAEYIDKCELCAGSTIGNHGPCVFTHSDGISFNNNVYWNLAHKATVGVRGAGAPWGSISAMGRKPYRITLKYTKA